MQKSFVLLGIIIGLTLSILPAHAQTQTSNILSVATSEEIYEEGDTVVITGGVTAAIGKTPVTIQIFYTNNLVEIAQLLVAQDGSFTHTINAEGPLWVSAGEYVVRASYGIDNVAETRFNFVTESSLVETSERFEVDAGNSGTFDVDYTIRGGTVSSMTIKSENFSLIVAIVSDYDGSITLDLPRDAMDAREPDGADVSYIVLIDGVEVPHEQITQNSEERTIKIEFEEGDAEIEIIGTRIIPEFGAMVMLVLAATVMSVIILTKKMSIPKSV